MKYLTVFAAILAASAAFAKVDHIAIDENDQIIPERAREVISNAASAVAKVEIANAKLEIIEDTIRLVDKALESVDEILKHRTDYALITLTATGVEDAVDSAGDDTQASIRFISDPETGTGIDIDRTSSAEYNIVTLYYSINGALTTPKIRAKSALDGEWLEDVEQTAPEQLSWGEEVYYRVIVNVPKSWGEATFFQITADIRTAIDDGKVFDIYSDSGVTGTFIVQPTEKIEFRLQAGRVINLRKWEAR